MNFGDLGSLQDLCGKFGIDPEAVSGLMQDPQMQAMMNSFSGMMAQGGMMPDDAEALAQQAEQMPGGLDGLFEKVSGLFGGGETEYEEIDLDEEVAAYQPAAEDAADRKFEAALKAWIAQTLTEIPADNVCMLEIGYHAAFDDADQVHYELWLAYNTEEKAAANRERFGTEVWNWINWADDRFRLFPEEPFAEWRQAQGYDEDNDGDEMIARIYDLAVVAVMELHQEHFTEQRFGRKVPFIIEDFEYYQKTAIRAVKANGGTALFDSVFFAECGFEDD